MIERATSSSANLRAAKKITQGTGDLRESHDVARVVREGLSAEKKSLPPWLFYDVEGSRLFVEITKLPEYYLGRAERSIFEKYGEQIIVQAQANDTGTAISFAELGAGTAEKTQILLHRAAQMFGTVSFMATDTSASALEIAVERLGREEPRVRVTPVAAKHEGALQAIASLPHRQFVMFIGSSIGNYVDADARALLADIRQALLPGAALLLGTDLKKDTNVLVRAYDDAAGVTAAFNKNMLVRINRELGAHFDLSRFEHRAIWNETASCIEMHLVSTVSQIVAIDALGMQVRFRKGESIHTESSVKYTEQRVDALFKSADFSREISFYDDEKKFAVHVARAGGASALRDGTRVK